ncbi:MAG: FAD-dependent oxidoreductase [Deltaproteobacteria bacterium]|nr:FAD-dependent oxidoreductase [Deltaproteobacteria bacterium]
MSMPKNGKSVGIIGGGFAGLSAAVFLDSAGFDVTLFEKKPILGGRAYAFLDRKTDTWVDNGQHLLIGAYHETLKLLENIGATRHLFFQKAADVPLFSTDNRMVHFKPLNLPPPFNILAGLIRMPIFSLGERIHFLGLGRELRRLKKGKPRVSLDQTVNDWLGALNQSENTRINFWDPLTLAVLNDDPDVAGARMLAAVLVKGFLGGKKDSRLILPKENLNELLAKPAQACLELRGQKIRLGEGIAKIHILNDRIQGLETDKGEIFRADDYMSAVPFSVLLRLIPPGFVETEPYFANLKLLKSSPIVSINLWFDRDILPHDFIGVAGRRVHWYFNKNRIYDVSHPPYHYMGVASGAYSLVDKSREEILEMTLKELNEAAPASASAHLIHSLVNKEREATLSPQAGSEKFRPKQKSPFANLYVIGDWTDTGLPATIESAVLSARLAVNDLERLL